MSANYRKAAGTAYIPDMEDWWDDKASNAPARQNRPRHRVNRVPAPAPVMRERAPRAERRKLAGRNRLLMYATLGVLVICLFLQVNRYAQMAAQTKHISKLVNEIKQLETDQTNLELRLSARANLERVRDAAMYNLGMDYPAEGQVRVVTLTALPPEVRSQMAVNQAD